MAQYNKMLLSASGNALISSAAVIAAHVPTGIFVGYRSYDLILRSEAPGPICFCIHSFMAFLTLEQDNREQVVATLAQHPWMAACLCAAWCGSCREYRAIFEQLAARHPQVSWIWIDIEDQADIVGDIDVENFPTLLIQRHDIVTYFGAVAPSLPLAERLLLSQMERSDEQLMAEASRPEREQWQTEYNLRRLLGSQAA